MRYLRKIVTGQLVFALLLGCVVPAVAQKSSDKTEISVAFREIRKEFAEAIKEAKSDNGQCGECHRRLQRLCFDWGAFEEGQKDARVWLRVASATNNDAEISEARHDLALHLLEQLEAAPKSMRNPKSAVEAEQMYAALLSIDPKDENARFDHGRAFAYLGRYNEAKAEFQVYLSHKTADDLRNRLAARFIADPQLAAHRIMPSIQIATANGKYFNSAAYPGRILLLDFWASWCGPCQESLPKLKAMLAQNRGRRFMALSISIDSHKSAWREAMLRYSVDWPQAIDDDGHLNALLSVQTVPHFVLMDQDHVVLYEGASIEKLEAIFPAALDAADHAAKQITSSTANHSNGN